MGDQSDKSESGPLRHALGWAVEVPSSIDDRHLWRRAVIFQFTYSVSGLVLGMCCLGGGLYLLVEGIGGSSSWMANTRGIQVAISDAAPGVILFLIGAVTVWITRFKIKIKKNED
jgi:hypothetical protein